LLVVAGLFAGIVPEPIAIAIEAGRVPAVRTTPHQGRVALTFDDGPNPTWTPVVLDVLDAYGVKATFFVNGFRVRAYPEVAAEIVRRGHSLQNHTYGHNRLPQLSDAGILRDILRGADSIREAAGVECTCLRPPWGLTSGRVRRIAGAAGESIVLWTIDSMDWNYQSAARTIDIVLGEVQAGDVILMHDSVGWVARDALPVIIAAVRAAGLEFETLCEVRNAPLAADLAPPWLPGIG
jgi:peptidoglycan-N-acetylglucosamine deacetylase